MLAPLLAPPHHARVSLPFSANTEGPYIYRVNGGEATITGFNLVYSGSLSIPDKLGGFPVTAIGFRAFELCSRLTAVTIPDSVTAIAREPFRDCASLATVTIPDSVTNINNYISLYCSSLTNINVSDGNPRYTDIGGVLFDKNCTKLIEYPGGLSGPYTIPTSVVVIGDSAFCGCTFLTAITIPDSVAVIGNSTFHGCTNLTTATISGNVAGIGDCVFLQCTSLTTATIPANVTNIGAWAFCSCASLTNITIPDNVTDIGQYAFYECTNFTTITIPAGVTNIGTWAFNSCTSLTNITVSGSNPKYADVDGVLFNKDRTTLLAYPGGLVGPYTIPDSVTAIGNSAFAGCVFLTAVTIPDSVTNIGKEAFHECKALTAVTIPDNVTNIGSRAFTGCNLLADVYFCGDAPSADIYLFYNTRNITVYRMQGKAGWPDVPAPWQDRPTALWVPSVPATNLNIGR